MTSQSRKSRIPPQDQYNQRRAFTLVEVALTIGLVAVALPCLLGLLSLALASQAEAELETRATLIAQSIFADLLHATTSHPEPTTATDPTGNPPPEHLYPTLATIASARDIRLLYSDDMLPVRVLDAHSFEAGLASGSTAAHTAALSSWMVRITMLRPEQIMDHPLAGTLHNSLSTCHIALSVEHPAGEPAHTREKIIFHTSVVIAEIR